MDLRKLERDWHTDPCLLKCEHETVEDLAAQLKLAHQYLMSAGAGPLGYLYQQQVKLVRELKHGKQERE